MRHPARQGRRHTGPAFFARAGLAPLELVLALPIMLFVMALIINIGTVGAWKVRTQMNHRYAAWRQIEQRTGNYDPKPANWSAGTLSSSTGAPLVSVQPGLGAYTGGSLVRTGNFAGIPVVRDLDMGERVQTGTASITRTVPFHFEALRRDYVDPNTGHVFRGFGGTYSFRVESNLLENAWQYHRLGYGSNISRRARLWWNLDPQVLAPAQHQATLDARDDLRQTMQSMLAPPAHGGLAIDPLDNDPDFIRLGRSPIDFHPTYQINPPEFDPNAIRNDTRRFEDPNDPGNSAALINRIRHLPGTMAQQFIALYTQELNRLQTPPQPGQPPPAPGPYTIAQLQQWISQLNVFLNSLPQRYQ